MHSLLSRRPLSVSVSVSAGSAAAHETSLQQGAAILCGGLLARLVFDWLRALGHACTPALAGALLAWSIPAFANVTLGAKPDIFAATYEEVAE